MPVVTEQKQLFLVNYSRDQQCG